MFVKLISRLSIYLLFYVPIIKLFHDINIVNKTIYAIATVSFATNLTLIHSIDNEYSLQLNKYFLWSQHDNDQSVQYQLTIEEAFFGVQKNITFDRIVIDDQCKTKLCEYCKGKLYVKTTKLYNNDGDQLGNNIKISMNKNHLYKELIIPCPVCLTGGLVTDSCVPYKKIQEEISVKFPPGSYDGYQIIIPGKVRI